MKPRTAARIVFLGDITDGGHHSLACYAYAKLMMEAGHAMWVMGNHDNKLMRYCDGRNVKRSHGLERTVRDIEQAGADTRAMYNFLKKLPYHLKLDEGRLITVHGAWSDELETEKPDSGKMRSWCLYAPTTGKTLPNGLPDRIDWVAQRSASETSPWIVYGHQPYQEARIENRTAGIDTSCVFGGKNMNELYMTSARVGLDEAALIEYPLTGGVFHLETNVGGMPTFEFAGKNPYMPKPVCAP